MIDLPNLLPRPRHLTRLPGETFLSEFTCDASDPAIRPVAEALEQCVVAHPPGRRTAVRFRPDPAVTHPQGYRLTVTADGVLIGANTAVGATYACRTLAQLGHHTPCLTIDDWPDFPVRGVMLDVSRDKVPTMATLFALVDRLAGWKINQLQLYTEHTFAYAAHRTVWEHASPITADEIRQLDAYCRERHVELVPNQNSFGHMERWLKHPAYLPLAECPDGADTGWGFRWDGPFSLCPTDPASLDLLAGLYAELLPNFTSGLFNVGCDETFDVGQGRSKPTADRIGTTGVYLDFLRKVNGLVRGHGRQMMFWGDVILHHPERIADLPPDTIALNWGYEADHPFDKEAAAFAAAGVPFYVCPGTSSWNSIAGRTDNCLANLANAAAAGCKHGAVGYLITDWGDHGHLQYLSSSYLGFMAGAALSWCGEANAETDWADALDRFAFDGERLGSLFLELGRVHAGVAKPNANGTTLFRLLVPSPADLHPERDVSAAELDAVDHALLDLEDRVRGVPPHSPARRELFQATHLLGLCVAAGRGRLGLPAGRPVDPDVIVKLHRGVWLARNRPGGLDDSCRRLRLP